MRLGTLRIDSRTARSLSYAAAGFTCVVLFLAFCLLLSLAMSPEAQEAHWLWRPN